VIDSLDYLSTSKDGATGLIGKLCKAQFLLKATDRDAPKAFSLLLSVLDSLGNGNQVAKCEVLKDVIYYLTFTGADTSLSYPSP